MKKIIFVLFIMLLFIKENFAQTNIPNQKPIIFEDVQQEAQFPGGLDSLKNYFQNNIKYPKKAIRKNIEGAVQIQFDICTDGTLCDYKVIKSVDKKLDEEALRVVKAMPNWKPAKQNGKAVKSRYKLPVTFILED